MKPLLFIFLLATASLLAAPKCEAGLLGDLTRVLDVNALVGSGKNNQGDGVQENQVKGNQQYWHNIFNYQKPKQ